MRDRKSGGDGGRVRVTEDVASHVSSQTRCEQSLQRRCGFQDPMAMHASAGGELEGDGRQVQDQKATLCSSLSTYAQQCYNHCNFLHNLLPGSKSSTSSNSYAGGEWHYVARIKQPFNQFVCVPC
eukprot:4660705-Amphidinium_carterae.1